MPSILGRVPNPTSALALKAENVPMKRPTKISSCAIATGYEEDVGSYEGRLAGIGMLFNNS